MIPRLKASLGLREIAAAFLPPKDAVAAFENAFAKKFYVRHAVAFSYGRSGLYFLLKALDLQNTEIILPSYTCVVVAHAIVLSGNIPRFVDSKLPDFNMDLDQVERSITEKTRAVLATHLFGYPLDLDRLDQIVKSAEARYGRKIYVIQDCAHSFGAEWKGRPVCRAGDAAIYGLNISKIITSVFGGMVTTEHDEIASKLRAARAQFLVRPPKFKSAGRFLYLVAAVCGFSKALYGLVNWLERKTHWLDSLTVYYQPGRIDFPKDFAEPMLPVEAAVGLVQLEKYDAVIRHRREMASFYDTVLKKFGDLARPPLVEGATYSHYVCLTKNRKEWLERGIRNGVQLGQLIEYAVHELDAYRPYAKEKLPVAEKIKDETLNFPVHAGVDPKKMERWLGGTEAGPSKEAERGK